jgi:hypothetical protein
MHLISLPFTFEVFAVGPVILALTTDLILLEFSIIEGTVSKSELSTSIFLAILILTFVFGAIRP